MGTFLVKEQHQMEGKTAAFGIYRQGSEAAHAVDVLRDSGFRNTDVSVLISISPGEKDLAVAKATKAPEGATAGGSTGAVLGGALGWLAAAGTLAIPGIGPFIAAGPLMALLGGVGVGGMIGGLAGALIGAGTPEYEAKRYEGRIRSGHVLLSVHCDDAERVKAAREVLERTGAEDISSTSESAATLENTDRPQIASDFASAHEADFRRDFGMNHADLGPGYETLAPSYEFGFRMARSEHFAGKNFEDVEPELNAVYLREFPGNDWTRISSLVLYGWERAGGMIRQGFALI
jgi:hypothetical protein